MTRRDLVMRIVRETQIDEKVVAEVLNRVLDGIIDALAAGETVEFRNFGVFKVRIHRPKVGRNPKRPEQVVIIPERRAIKFKPGLIMREKVLRESPSADNQPANSSP